MTIERRLTALERFDAETVIAWRWRHDGYVYVDGERMPLDEYNRLYPDAIVIDMDWGDDHDQAYYSAAY